MNHSSVKRAFIAGAVVLVLFSFSLMSVSDVFDASQAMSPYVKSSGYTLVIDAGHGGADGGAVSASGSAESAINLKIAQKAELIAGLYGVSPVMTRTGEEIDYPPDADTIRKKKVADQRSRVSLINETENAFLISIHQNKYTSSGPTGAQVFYKNVSPSEVLAKHIQELLISEIDPTNRRPAAAVAESVYLLKNITCPAILVECGFLSNPREAALLETEEYQLKTAVVIMGGYLGFNEPA